MTAASNLHSLQIAVTSLLEQFPAKIEPSLPALSGAAPYSPDDFVRFGVVAIEGSAASFKVRTSYLTETVEEIQNKSLFYLRPILQIEDPEKPEALKRGRYQVICRGWKIEEGEQGDPKEKAELLKILESTLKSYNIAKNS